MSRPNYEHIAHKRSCVARMERLERMALHITPDASHARVEALRVMMIKNEIRKGACMCILDRSDHDILKRWETKKGDK